MILHRRRAAKRDRLSRTISDTYRSQSQGAPMNREDAWNILCEHTKTEPLRKHALAVEAAMRAYAGKYGGGEGPGGVGGLPPHFDFQMHPKPQEHPVQRARNPPPAGVPEGIGYGRLLPPGYLRRSPQAPLG